MYRSRRSDRDNGTEFNGRGLKNTRQIDQKVTMMVPQHGAQKRLSNAVGDVALGILHLVFFLKALGLARRHKSWRRQALAIVVPAYFFTLSGFQIMGAAFHLIRPAPARLDAAWLLYLTCGALAPCLYGVALSLDCIASDRNALTASAAWLVGCGIYVALATAQLDLALFVQLPTVIEVSLPPWVARSMRELAWMPSALRRNRQSSPGEAPLRLRFDGRGYASIPFASVFDDEYESVFDLVAPFPCWRTDSLTFLMLTVGVLCNTCHIAICRSAQRPVLGHLSLILALVTMPPVMLCHGVQAGIDAMHAGALPTLLLQAKHALDLARQRPTARRPLSLVLQAGSGKTTSRLAKKQDVTGWASHGSCGKKRL